MWQAFSRQNNSSSRLLKGFTLVELLVVISIIALLMAILMPSLNAARDQARNVVCQSNVRQFGQVFLLYTIDNNDRFHAECGPKGEFLLSKTWLPIMRPYYQTADVRLCPKAKKRYIDGGVNPFGAWDLSRAGGTKEDYGSYGINNWVANPPSHPTSPGLSADNFVAANFWRTSTVKGGDNIPLFLDCWWYRGFPQVWDKPPPERDMSQIWKDFGHYADLQRYALDRHRGAVNGVMMDFSVKRIGLKSLWSLKWHRNYKERPQVWPTWMADLK